MILVAGLAPAWQRIMLFDALRIGAVNRARRIEECASGKAVNAALAVRFLEGPVKLLSLAGGESGNALRRDLRETGLEARWIETAVATRVCTTLLEKGRATELIENMGEVRPEELRAFADAFAGEAASARAVVLTGSLPVGTPRTVYRDLVSASRAPVVLDAWSLELLEALPRKPFLVKPNRRELADSLGRELPDDRSLEAAMAEVRERGAEWVVVTDGGGPIRILGRGRAAAFRPPPAETVNPIGCGDCMAGAIALEISRGRDPVEALPFGIAAAVDRMGQVLPSRLDPARVARIAGLVRAL